jgi:kinesin family protein 1
MTNPYFFIRPYIYIYTNQSETEEQGIINVSNVRIDYNRALEQMIRVS